MAALACVAWQVPHAAYHLVHVGDLPTLADKVAQPVLLLLAVALTLAIAAARGEVAN